MPKILLGVTGSIAAYKSAFLVRLMVKEGWEVRVIQTQASTDFIGPLTLSTLSKNEVLIKYQDSETGSWNNHVELGLWPDLFLIAPATANTIAKAANGLCDNLLLASYLSSKAPVVWAPAMDLDMFKHPASTENLKRLRSFGDEIIEPDSGELASGLVGQGRMSEPEAIIEFLKRKLKTKSKKKRVLVTAGPTYEKIDPVRFIGNYSSGKMGYAIAEALAEKGFEVDLVSGPSNETINHPLINLHSVESAEEMYKESQKSFKGASGAILSAAVADYRPKMVYGQKKKKEGGNGLNLQLVETRDIAKSLGEKKRDRVLVGFALETESEEENAKDKIKRKNLDMIVLNSLNDPGAGFRHDTNKAKFFFKGRKKSLDFPLMSKKELAMKIVLEFESLLK